MESKLMVPNDDTLPIWSSKQKKPQKGNCSSRDFALATVHLEKLQEGHSDLSCPVLGCRDRISHGSLRQCILQDIVPQAPADTEQRLSWTAGRTEPQLGLPQHRAPAPPGSCGRKHSPAFSLAFTQHIPGCTTSTTFHHGALSFIYGLYSSPNNQPLFISACES